jgi:hypothetical protein
MKETIEESAERWVFDINGHKWSNNNDTAGDNYGSFIAGYKLAQDKFYSEEEVFKAQQAILCNIKDALINENYIIEYLEQFKKNSL